VSRPAASRMCSLCIDEPALHCSAGSERVSTLFTEGRSPSDRLVNFEHVVVSLTVSALPAGADALAALDRPYGLQGDAQRCPTGAVGTSLTGGVRARRFLTNRR